MNFMLETSLDAHQEKKLWRDKVATGVAIFWSNWVHLVGRKTRQVSKIGKMGTR